MEHVSTLLQISFAYGLAIFLGLGPVLTFFPAALRPYAPYAAPATGYVMFCFVTILASSLGGNAVVHTNALALAVLAAWSILAAVRRRGELRGMLPAWKPLALLFAVMMTLVFLPVLDMGAGLYLGTVNPDFLQSLAFQQALVESKLAFWVLPQNVPAGGFFQELLFPSQFQARFGGVAYGVLLQQVTGATARASLMTAIVAFVLCLPPTVYFFSRTVLEFPHRVAVLAAAMVAISASTTMSFIHALLGQNSALATFPLAIALVYLAARERSIGLAVLAAIFLNAVFWVYVMVLPYVLAPFGLYLLLKWGVQGRRATAGLWITAAVVAAVSALTHVALAAQTVKFLADLSGLLKGIGLTGFYRDFLTEDVFIYATGLSSYSIVHNTFFLAGLSTLWTLLRILAFVLAAVYFLAVRRWERTASSDAALMVFSLLATYIAVWFYYTFVTRYGYASFKMAAWLQFIAAPFFAWMGVHAAQSLRAGAGRRRAASAAILALVTLYVSLNVLSVVDYDIKSYGRDRVHGSLINSYGISGNRDFVDLPGNVGPRLAPGSSLALGFDDYIENLVAAEYASALSSRISMLSHDRLPDDDSFLPDVLTRRTLDTAGHFTIYEPAHFNDGVADFYLLPSSTDRNNDIVATPRKGKPLWEDATFALFRRADLSDLAFTARGFFRIEHFDRGAVPWWWPETFRWTAEGGEIYHLLPSQPGAAYRIEFSAIAGLGLPTGTRTVEVWHNQLKIDEVVVRGAARVVSKPYYPVAGVNRLVLKIKEKAALGENRFGLWNRDLSRNVRQLNLLVSDVAIRPASAPGRAPLESGRPLPPKEFLDAFETFDGFDVDGWIRESARFAMRVPQGSRTLAVKLLVPGNLGFAFPFHVRFSVNGQAVEREFAAPGEFEVKIPVPPAASGEWAVEIVPQSSARIADGMEQREVVQSVRLGELGVSNE
ncbi:MAG: hypothetical protein ACXWBQ_07500 [Usitatibacter sp.]